MVEPSPAARADAAKSGLLHTEASLSAGQLAQCIAALGVPYGREDSFKLRRKSLIRERMLIGVPAAYLSPERVFALAVAFGMPAAGRHILEPLAAQASTIFFGSEDRPDGSVFKLYLEFWDQVRQNIGLHPVSEPLLLHIGIKWDTARPGTHEVARYHCHPLLSTRDALRRIGRIYAGSSTATAAQATQSIVRAAAMKAPGASMIYLEVEEENNPRASFDINLYKTALPLGAVAPQLRQAAAEFGIDAAAIEDALRQYADRPLGHLSGGIDRHGQDFLTVYIETRRLDAPAPGQTMPHG